MPHFTSAEPPSPDLLHLIRYFEESRLTTESQAKERRCQEKCRWTEEEQKRCEEDRRWRQEEAERRKANSDRFLLVMSYRASRLQTRLSSWPIHLFSLCIQFRPPYAHPGSHGSTLHNALVYYYVFSLPQRDSLDSWDESTYHTAGYDIFSVCSISGDSLGNSFAIDQQTYGPQPASASD